MSKYAAETTVSPEKSRAEIERTLARFGATAFAYGWDQSAAMIQFEAHDRRIRFALPMPDRNDRQFTHTPKQGTRRSPAEAEKAYDKAVRQKWRALGLVVKAKLEAVESGISEFETEFLAHVVLPDGSTVGEWIGPQIETAYDTGQMPAMLPELGTGR